MLRSTDVYRLRFRSRFFFFRFLFFWSGLKVLKYLSPTTNPKDNFILLEQSRNISGAVSELFKNFEKNQRALMSTSSFDSAGDSHIDIVLQRFKKSSVETDSE